MLHPFTVDRSLEAIDTATKVLDDFAVQLDIEINQKTIERARRWNELAGEAIAKAAEDTAANAAELGGKVADGAQGLGGAIADSAGALGEAIGNIDVSKALDMLPVRLPFGKQ